MAETLEARVAGLEGKVEEQSHLGSGVRECLGQLDQKVDRFRAELAAASIRWIRKCPPSFAGLWD